MAVRYMTYEEYKRTVINTSVQDVIFGKAIERDMVVGKLFEMYNMGLIPTLYYYKTLAMVPPDEHDKDILIDVMKLRRKKNAYGYYLTY